MKGEMKFSWMALVLAPLPIPFLYSVLLEASAPGKSPVPGNPILYCCGLCRVLWRDVISSPARPVHRLPPKAADRAGHWFYRDGARHRGLLPHYLAILPCQRR